MPHEIKLDDEVGCYFVHWTGAVELSEVSVVQTELAKMDWFRTGLNALYDFRIAKLRLTRSDILKAAQARTMTATMYGAGRVACVVHGKVAGALLRTFARVVTTAERHLRVFTDYEAAKAWLGLPAHYATPFDREEGHDN